MKLWNAEWEAFPKARQTKLFHDRQDQKTFYDIIQWTCLKLGRYIWAVMGDSNLLYYLHTIDHSISPICLFCLQANEDFHHLATTCPPFWWDRHFITTREAFISPLYQITTTQSNAPNASSQDHMVDDPDDPAPINSTSEQSYISIMDCTSETDSSNQPDDNIDIDIKTEKK